MAVKPVMPTPIPTRCPHGEASLSTKQKARNAHTLQASLNMAPRPGLEPGTYGLTVDFFGTFWDVLGFLGKV